MSDEDSDQRRDALLRQAMKSPPLTREQLKDELRRARATRKAAKQERPSDGDAAH